jgi:hypothetical protein
LRKIWILWQPITTAQRAMVLPRELIEALRDEGVSKEAVIVSMINP